MAEYAPDEVVVAPVTAADHDHSSQRASEPEREPGFLSELRSRMIIGSPMDADVRITFLLGGLTLFVAMAVDVTRALLGPHIATFQGSIPVGALVAFVIGQFLVFTLFFRGVLQLRRHVRNGVLAVSALFFLLATSATIHYLLAAPITVLWYFADTKDQFSPKASWLPAALTSAGLSIIFLFIAVTGGDVILFVIGSAAAMLTSIGLFAAATDIAEIAQVAGDTIAQRLPMQRSRWLCTLAACASAFAPFEAGRLHAAPSPANVGAASAVLVAFALIPYWMVISIGRKRKLAVGPHVPYPSLLTVVAIFGLSFEIAMITQYEFHKATFDAGNFLNYVPVSTPAFWLLLASAIGLAIFGRRSSTTFMTFGFGATVGIWWYFSFRQPSIFWVPFGVAQATPVVLAIVAAWPKTRERFAPICELLVSTNLAIALYTVIAFLFLVPTSHLTEGSLLQGLIVLMALAWDMVTSKSVTLSHSASVPRNARVSFFIAYLSLVGLLVMISSASTFMRPRGMEHVFDSEWYVGTGLHLFGAPLLLFVFALRMRTILSQPAPTPLGGTKLKIDRSADNAQRDAQSATLPL